MVNFYSFHLRTFKFTRSLNFLFFNSIAELVHSHYRFIFSHSYLSGRKFFISDYFLQIQIFFLIVISSYYLLLYELHLVHLYIPKVKLAFTVFLIFFISYYVFQEENEQSVMRIEVNLAFYYQKFKISLLVLNLTLSSSTFTFVRLIFNLKTINSNFFYKIYK